MPAGGPRMQNFQGVPGGMGGLGGGTTAGQAMSIARRMGTQPIGADPRPGMMGMGAQQGMQAGGHPDVHMAYNDQVVRKLPMADQQARGKQTAKAEGAADHSKALQEISKLMGPDIGNPFEELQGYQQHQQNPFPGAPMPRAAPYSIRNEPPANDMTRDLEKAVPLIYRALAVAASRGRGQDPIMGGSLRGEVGQNIKEAGPEATPDIGNLPIMPGPWEGHPTHDPRAAAIRHGRQRKRGGVAKRALALAKRRKKTARGRK